jgi:hypothetical protein
MQNGFYIVSGTRGDNNGENVPSGSYKLITLEEPHPAFIAERKTGLMTNDFEELKKSRVVLKFLEKTISTIRQEIRAFLSNMKRE